MSVIEREFNKGIVEAKDIKEDCFAIVRWVNTQEVTYNLSVSVRVIHNMSFSDMEKVSRYVDTVKDGSVDKNATEMAVRERSI